MNLFLINETMDASPSIPNDREDVFTWKISSASFLCSFELIFSSLKNRSFVVPLMDTTGKVFFMDSCQVNLPHFTFGLSIGFLLRPMFLSLSLSGHCQPVLCLENSSSSRLLISGSSDRKIKIWNRDFGGCHRSFFAHDDTITAIQFENEMENDQYLLPGETKKEVALPRSNMTGPYAVRIPAV
jgi:WD40 repeat protein